MEKSHVKVGQSLKEQPLSLSSMRPITIVQLKYYVLHWLRNPLKIHSLFKMWRIYSQCFTVLSITDTLKKKWSANYINHIEGTLAHQPSSHVPFLHPNRTLIWSGLLLFSCTIHLTQEKSTLGMSLKWLQLISHCIVLAKVTGLVMPCSQNNLTSLKILDWNAEIGTFSLSLLLEHFFIHYSETQNSYSYFITHVRTMTISEESRVNRIIKSRVRVWSLLSLWTSRYVKQ